ncbi:MAG: DNA repair protein RadA [Elusimicrobia bacterium]|nr:DNA repair protein RadA [Elusimicrobiota bacterium]
MRGKTIFSCSHCGRESAQWLGQCPDCASWNSFTQTTLNPQEIKESKTIQKKRSGAALKIQPFLDEGGPSSRPLRRTSGFDQLDCCLGGGFLDGSLILLGGAPGVGKSTLMAEIAGRWAAKGLTVLYSSGEEEVGQVRDRLLRLGIEKSSKLLLGDALTLEDLIWKVEEIHPQLVVVDSVQTLTVEEAGYPQGSPALIRSVTARLLSLAKKEKIVIVLLGHITKEGHLAGPKHLEHMVDVVVQMEKPRAEEFRFVRVLKNRFGPSHALAVFEMKPDGFRQVKDPSQSFISEHWKERIASEQGRLGFASALAMDAGQPFLVQTEALLGKKRMVPGRHSAIGVDPGRLNMLVAVLEQALGLSLEFNDIYLSLIGGARVRDPGIDLALTMALGSVIVQAPVATDTAFLGEVSLSGDVLVPRDLDARLNQAKTLGFQKILYPQKGFWKIKDFIRILSRAERISLAAKTVNPERVGTSGGAVSA